MDVKEVLLPGVGLRYEFTSYRGDRIGIVARRSGGFDVVLYGRDDPDEARPVLRLTDEEAEAVAQILGAPRIAERFTELTREVPGLKAGQIHIRAGSLFVDRPLGDTRARTRTGASIVAIVRDEDVLASPGPTDVLRAGDVLIVIGTEDGIAGSNRSSKRAEPVEVSRALLFELGVLLAVLAVLGAVARRFALSPIPVYLLAGLSLGNGGILGVAAAGEFIATGAPIGVVLLLLALGLEFSATEFASSLRHHLPSAGVDIVLNATPGAVAGWLLGLDGVAILGLAGVTYISSSGVIARLLEDLRRLGNRETPAVLSVLVLEDFAMAAYLPLFAVLATDGSWLEAVVGMTVAIAALLGAFAASYRWGHHVGRLVTHPDSEQLLLRVLGITLIVAAVAESLHASAAVGAFLVGLTLTGETADRARMVLTPLRDLFATIFFLGIGLSVDPGKLVSMLPVALALAAVTAATKVATGMFAARREGVARRGQLRAGTALVARGEFSLIIIGLAGASIPGVAALATAYVFVMAIVGPILARYTGGGLPAAAVASN